MASGKILVVDSDKDICEIYKNSLENEGYSVIIANTAEEALVKFDALKPSMLLTEIILPSVDGWQLCREIRQKSPIPIIIISSKVDTFDKVLGLELGADDYMSKPFDIKEVIARMKAISRRTATHIPDTRTKEINYENFSINMVRYELKIRGEIVETPPKELDLLFHLASNPNEVFTRDQLLDEVWGFEYYGDSRTIDVHIKRLRDKLKNISAKWALKTVWGRGYKFEAYDR